MELSIVVPTSRPVEQIQELIQSILYLELDFEMEILIIPNGPNKESYSQRPLLGAEREWVVILPWEGLGANSARNHGANKARGKYLLFIDDDCTLSSTTKINELLKESSSCSEKIVFGSYYLCRLDMTPLQVAYNIICNAWIKNYGHKKSESSYMFLGGCLLISRNLFQQTMGWNENQRGVAEEASLIDFFYRSNIEVKYSKNLSVVHRWKGTFLDLLKKAEINKGGPKFPFKTTIGHSLWALWMSWSLSRQSSSFSSWLLASIYFLCYFILVKI